MEVKTRIQKTDFGTVWFVSDAAKTFRFALYQYDDEKDIMYLSNVFVFKKFRGNGIGNCILDSADEIAKRKNIRKLFLKVKSESFAHSWYKRHGYSNFSDAGNGYTWMSKDIK